MQVYGNCTRKRIYFWVHFFLAVPNVSSPGSRRQPTVYRLVLDV